MRLTSELKAAMERFHARFGDAVPLMMMIPPSADEKEIIRAIDVCLDHNSNDLSKIFDYDGTDESKIY